MTRSHRNARIIVTLGCFLMATFAWGTVFYGHSVYMDALTRERGWSTALISTSILVFWFSSLPGTLSVGYLIDRRGPVPVVVIGALCIGIGLIALGHVTQRWQLFAVYIVLGFGYPAMAAAAISPTLAPWFDKGFGAALGVALSGASVGGAIVPVLMVYSTARNGFEMTMLVAGGSVLATLAVVAIVLAQLGRPEGATSARRDEIRIGARERLRDPLFWRIAVAAALGLGGQVGLLAHQIPIVAVHGTPEAAALAVTVVAVGSAVGRLVISQASRVVPVTLLRIVRDWRRGGRAVAIPGPGLYRLRHRWLRGGPDRPITTGSGARGIRVDRLWLDLRACERRDVYPRRARALGRGHALRLVRQLCRWVVDAGGFGNRRDRPDSQALAESTRQSLRVRNISSRRASSSLFGAEFFRLADRVTGSSGSFCQSQFWPSSSSSLAAARPAREVGMRLSSQSWEELSLGAVGRAGDFARAAGGAA
jgi:MFS family permease